jgi:hypothetical protein
VGKSKVFLIKGSDIFDANGLLPFFLPFQMHLTTGKKKYVYIYFPFEHFGMSIQD